MASQALATPLTTPAHAVPAPSQTPTVMIVDSDSEVVAHCARMLDDLNYPHIAAPSAREALELLIREPAIEIVVACAHLPLVDAFMLIEEARARVGPARPLAFVAMSAHMTTEIALRSLHFEAADLLAKPPAFEDWSLALRRASRYLGARRKNSDDVALSNFGQQLGQNAVLGRGISRRAKTDDGICQQGVRSEQHHQATDHFDEVADQHDLAFGF